MIPYFLPQLRLKPSYFTKVSSEEDIAIEIMFRLEGLAYLTYDQISKILGRDVRTIRRRLTRLGLSRSDWRKRRKVVSVYQGCVSHTTTG